MFKINYKHETFKETFPEKIVIEYLQLKAQGKSKKEIMHILKIPCTYLEERLRKYILKRMDCKSINQAVILACRLKWIIT